VAGSSTPEVLQPKVLRRQKWSGELEAGRGSRKEETLKEDTNN